MSRSFIALQEDLFSQSLPVLRATPNPTLAIMVMDGSSSMREHGYAPRNALCEHVDALKGSELASSICSGIVVFAREPTIVIPVQPVNQIGAIAYTTSHGSHIYGTMQSILRAIVELKSKNVRFKTIIHVFSDGEDNAPDSTEEQVRLKKLAARVQPMCVEIFTNGFGISGRKLARCMGFNDDEEHARTLAADSESIRASVQRATRLTILTASRVHPPISASRLN